MLSLSPMSVADTDHRKKPTGKNTKVVRDDNTKELFENHEFARNGTGGSKTHAHPRSD
jgi:hypothetical protein